MGRWLMLVVAVLGFACGSEPSSPRLIEVRGSIGFQDLEGGWWYLTSESGEHYTPMNLPASLRIQGLRVQATLARSPDQVGFLPGPYVDVIQIEPLAGF